MYIYRKKHMRQMCMFLLGFCKMQGECLMKKWFAVLLALCLLLSACGAGPAGAAVPVRPGGAGAGQMAGGHPGRRDSDGTGGGGLRLL